MRVWIDVAHGPQVRFLQPIEWALRERGDEVVLSVREHGEAATLAREAWPGIVADSGASPDERLQKGAALAARAVRLARWAHAQRPDVALSHNSYAQILAARALRIPAVTAMDYEHQPANHLAFRLATRVVVPEVFPDEALRRFGAAAARVRRYQGLKEEMYIERAADDAAQRSLLGLGPEEPYAVVRLPPEGTLYHRHANELVDALIARLVDQRATVLVLARTDAQRRVWSGRTNVIILDPPVDAQALLHGCTVFVGAGGTMTREAALIGAPTYSIFAGRPAAADAWLEQQGRLSFLHTAREVSVLDLASARRVRPVETVQRCGALEVVLSAVDEVT